MRTIRDILSEEERVWLYFDTEELCRQFYEETDLRFGDLPKEKWQTGYVIGAHSDGTMGHLSLYLWCRSFSSDSPTIPKRIDYRKLLLYRIPFQSRCFSKITSLSVSCRYSPCPRELSRGSSPILSRRR